jgi:nucleotide-binding universal stress UspA family protein
MPPVSEEMEMHEHIAMQEAEWVARERRVAEEIVESAVEQLKSVGLATTAIVKEEEPKRLPLGEAESWDADCVSVGARGHSRLEQLLLVVCQRRWSRARAVQLKLCAPNERGAYPPK